MTAARILLTALLAVGPTGAVAAATCTVPQGGATAAQLAACRTDVADTEADLAKALRRLRAQTPMELRTSLGKSQQAWQAYRAAQCVFEGGGAPGAVNVAALSCTATMNRDRIETLEQALMRGE